MLFINGQSGPGIDLVSYGKDSAVINAGLHDGKEIQEAVVQLWVTPDEASAVKKAYEAVLAENTLRKFYKDVQIRSNGQKGTIRIGKRTKQQKLAYYVSVKQAVQGVKTNWFSIAPILHARNVERFFVQALANAVRSDKKPAQQEQAQPGMQRTVISLTKKQYAECIVTLLKQHPDVQPNLVLPSNNNHTIVFYTLGRADLVLDSLKKQVRDRFPKGFTVALHINL